MVDATEKTARPRHVPLTTIQDVRRRLARCIKKLETGAMPPDQGRVLVYAYSKLAEMIRAADFEERLARLERRETEAESEAVQ